MIRVQLSPSLGARRSAGGVVRLNCSHLTVARLTADILRNRKFLLASLAIVNDLSLKELSCQRICQR